MDTIETDHRYDLDVETGQEALKAFLQRLTHRQRLYGEVATELRLDRSLPEMVFYQADDGVLVLGRKAHHLLREILLSSV